MADVQPDKFTKIANELLEIVPQFKLNGTQLRIIMVTWRYTYGFKRKDHSISIGFFEKATGLSRRQVQKEVNNLIKMNVLFETQKATFNKPRMIGFNKDYDSWSIEHSGTKKQEVNNKTQANDSSPLQANDSSPLQANHSSPKKESIKETTKETDDSGSSENPFTFYQQNFGVLSPFMAESVGQWCEDMSDELVVEAMKIALKNGKQFKYSEGILRKWNQNGISSLEDVKADQSKHERETEQQQEQYTIDDQIKEVEEYLSLGKEYYERRNRPDEYDAMLKERNRLEQLRENQRQGSAI